MLFLRHVEELAYGSVACTVVAADDHVLDGLPGAGHVHAVGQVGPPQARVVHFLLEHLVCAKPHNSWNIIILHIH